MTTLAIVGGLTLVAYLILAAYVGQWLADRRRADDALGRVCTEAVRQRGD